MIRFLANYCKRIPKTKVEIDKLGNIFVTKGKSETYPCIVAHTDQVQRLHPKDFVAIETRELIFGYSPSTRQQCGLGADDKNGIWIALKCLEKYPIMKAAFFVGEEIGCLGSESCNMSFFDDTRFVIQCDRRGYKDLITEICGINLCSDEFLEDIKYQSFGYAKEHGLTTDVGTLKERQLPVCAINISCGYYNPHSDEEITVKDKDDNFVGYSYQRLLDVLKEKEDKSEYNIVVYYEWWLMVIFDGLYSIGESEVESFLVYFKYIGIIATNSILLDEHKENMTNKQFVERFISLVKEFTGDIDERVLFKALTDEERMKQEIDAITQTEQESMMEQ